MSSNLCAKYNEKLKIAFIQWVALTLKKIKDTGVITLGHRESSIPFSYYDDKQQVIGYSHEMMLKAVDGIKAD
jgi:glutamate/aspartate transport system substrate-binding protein